MLRSVQPYTFFANYHDVVVFILSSGEKGPFGNRLRTFRERPGAVMRECCLSETQSLYHAACLGAHVQVCFGPNGELFGKHFDYPDGVYHSYEIDTGLHMFITFDHRRDKECEGRLWIEQNPRQWLARGPVPSLVRLRDGTDVGDGFFPSWVDPWPGELAIKYCLDVWGCIIHDWERHLEPTAEETMVLSVEIQSTLKPECWSFRNQVRVAMNKLIEIDEYAELTQDQMAGPLSLTWQRVREKSSEHKKCCGFDWIRDVKERRLLDNDE